MPDWQEILARDGPAAWQTAYRLLGNRADADDCFQEACLAALDVSRRETVHHWRALFLRLATVRALDYLRARTRVRRIQSLPHEQQAELPDPSPAPVQNAEEAELAGELRLALTQIPARQAEVFCLHCLEDWSYEEIARHACMSVSAVGVQIHRARKRLRELLARFQDKAAGTSRAIDRGAGQQREAHGRKEHS